MTSSWEETKAAGMHLASLLPAKAIITLSGELGAGKTTFVKGIVEACTKIESREVNSPTFTYINSFSGNGHTIYHFDLYRLKNAQEFLAMGFDEYFDQGICCIEWAEKIPEILPNDRIHVEILYKKQEGLRVIKIHPTHYDKNTF